MPVQNTATIFIKTASNTIAKWEMKTSQETLMGFITNLQVQLCEMQCNNSTWSKHFQLCEMQGLQGCRRAMESAKVNLTRAGL